MVLVETRHDGHVVEGEKQWAFGSTSILSCLGRTLGYPNSTYTGVGGLSVAIHIANWVPSPQTGWTSKHQP